MSASEASQTTSDGSTKNTVISPLNGCDELISSTALGDGWSGVPSRSHRVTGRIVAPGNIALRTTMKNTM